MDCIELDVEVVVADEAFDIHPPHPTVVCDAHVDAAWEHAREINPDAHVQAWIVYFDDMPF